MKGTAGFFSQFEFRRDRRRLRFVLSLAGAVGAFALLTAQASAQTVAGSSTSTSTCCSDSAAGQVYVYTGGSFSSGVTVTTVNWANLRGSSTHVMTPILFEQTSAGVFVVRGVGTSRTSPNAANQAAFGLQYGTATTANSNYTWGFINYAIAANGAATAATTGAVDWSSSVIGGSGAGGGSTTNAWSFTPSNFSTSNLALGTTLSGLFGGRTYAANLAGTLPLTVAPSSIMFRAAAGQSSPASVPVSVCSAASGSTYTTSSNQSWLTTTPTSNATGARSTIGLSAATGSLSPGVYNGKVTYSAAGFSSPATSVMLQLAGPSGTLTQVSANQLGASVIATGDFNGDGAIDFATTNYFNNTVSIHINKGNNAQGVFQGFNIATISSANFAFPTGIAVADFNADGNLDIAVTNNNAPSMVIMLGNGDGTFQSSTLISTGSNLYQGSIAAGDFDGDCIPDLILANNASPNNAQLWKGDGKGGFSLETTVSLGAGGVALIGGDFNGDGKLDFAAIDMGNDSAGNSYVWIALGNGSGGFTKSPIAVTGTGISIVAADLNSDGIMDVAVLTTQQVATLLGHLTTGPTSVNATYAVSTTPAVDHGIGIGDINGDGKPDFIISAVTNVATAVMGDGAGGFGRATLIANETDTGYAVVDVNGDGIPDLIAANFYYNSFSLLASQTEVFLGSVPATSTTLTTTAASTVAAGTNIPLSISVSGGAGFNALSGTVAIYDGATPLGTATLGNTAGTWTFSTSALAPGTHSLTAVYGNDSFNKTSTGSAISITVNSATETLTLSPITTSSTYGQSVTFTATLSAAPASGSVTFYDGATLLGTGALSGATATYTTSALTGGTHSITAQYSGAAGYSSATSGAQIQWVGPAAATVTLSNLNQSVNGSPESATATTTPTSLANTTYYSGAATTLQGSTVTATWDYPNQSTVYGSTAYVNGSGSVSTATGTVGTTGLQFNSLAVDASNQTFKVNVYDTLIAISDIRGVYTSGQFGNPVPGTTFNGLVITTTATLTSVNLAYSNWISPTTAFSSSNITFDSHHIYLNFAGMLTIAGQQVILTINSGTTAPSATGTYGVASVVSGPNYTGYTTGSLVIAPPPVTVTLTPATLNQTYTGSPLSAQATTSPTGLTVTFTYTGTGSTTYPTSSTPPTNPGTYTVVASATNNGATGNATGTLTITGATATVTLGSLSQTWDGTTKAATASTTPSGLSVTLAYAQNGNPATPKNAGSYTVTGTVTSVGYTGSGTGTLVISPATSAVTLAGSAAVPYGQNVTLTATVTPATATGTVAFVEGGTTLATATLSGGTASYTTNTLSVNNHSITAVYSGDSNVSTSTSDAVIQSVYTATGAIALTYSPASVAYLGGPISFTATVTPSIATGTVNFHDYYGTSLGSATISSGVATLTLPSNPLGVGNPGVYATYVGPGVSFTSSPNIPVTVTPASSTLSLTSSANPSFHFDFITLTATLGPAKLVNESGTVSFYDGATLLGTGTMYAGTATLATNAFTSGTHSLTAVYSGDGNTTGSTSNAISQVVNLPVGTVTLTGFQLASDGVTNVPTTTPQVPYGSNATVRATALTGATGTITFRVDGVAVYAPYPVGGAFGSGNTAVTSFATVTTPGVSVTLAPGTHTVTAVYSGDANYLGSTSQTVTVTVLKGVAAINFSNLVFTYDGAAKTPAFTTTPANLAVSFTYNGNASSPSAAGIYTVVGTVNDATFAGTATGTMYIKRAATISFSGSPVAADGTPKAITATTNPPGLNVALTYNGSATVPSAAGTYNVVATIVDNNYIGSATTTLQIVQPTPSSSFITAYGATTVTFGSPVNFSFSVLATGGHAPTGTVSILDGNTVIDTQGFNVSFGVTSLHQVLGETLSPAGPHVLTARYNGDLYNSPSTSAPFNVQVSAGAATVTLTGFSAGTYTAVYTGSPIAVTATTTPAGKSVSITYNGSATAPKEPGSYNVVAALNDPSYTSTPATGTLVISKAPGTVTLAFPNAIDDGVARPATATTTPAGLNVTFTYNGSATVPTIFGSYTVVGTINDNHYAGSATGTMLVQHIPTFTAASGSPLTLSTPNPLQAIATGDYNGDGKADTAYADYAGGIYFRLSNTSGGYTLTQVVTPGGVNLGTPYITTGDFNADGVDDVAVALSNGFNVIVVLGSTTNSFTVKLTSTGGQVFGIAAGAFFNFSSQNPDLVILQYPQNPRVEALPSNGDGTFNLNNMAYLDVNVTGATGPIAVAHNYYNGATNILVPRPSLHEVTYYTRIGAGFFRATTVSLPGLTPTAAVALDYNNDNSVDFAVLSSSAGTTASVTLLKSSSGGTLTTAGSFALTNPSVFPVGATGDFNGDGKADLVLGNGATSNLSVYYGDGTGNFTLNNFYATSSPVLGVVAGDFNQDGLADLETLDASNRSTLLLNTYPVLSAGPAPLVLYAAAGKAGTPAIPVTVSSNRTGQTYSAASNQPWLTVSPGTNPTGSPSTVSLTASAALLHAGTIAGKVTYTAPNHIAGVTPVTLNVANPSGSLTPSSPVRSQNFSAGPMVSADFNGDGIPDFATLDVSGRSGSQAPIILTLSSTNGYQQSSGYANYNSAVPSGGYGPSSMVTGDFNSDGYIDLVLGNSSGQSLSFFRGTNYGNLSSGSPVPVGDSVQHIVAGDFNGDGKTDVLALGNNVTLMTGDGTGNFHKTTVVTNTAFTGYDNGIYSGDFNGDGKLDFAVLTASGQVVLMLGDGTGRFSAASVSPLSIGGNGVAVGADFNADGLQDLAILTGTQLVILRGDRTAGLVRSSTLTVASAYNSGVAVADLNGDGNPDIVFGASASGTGALQILLGDGAGNFTVATPVSLTSSGQPVSVVAGDFNGDGRIDVASVDGSFYPATVISYGGTSSPTATLTITSTGSNPALPTTYTFGQAASFRMALSFPANPFATPTGTFTLLDGSTVIATAPSLSAPFTFNISTLTAGKHSLHAVYSGDATNAASGSSIVTVTIQKAAASIAIATPAPGSTGQPVSLQVPAVAVAGDPVVLSATVTPAGASALVSFVEGSTVIGTATPDSTGLAQFTTTTLSTGTHSIVASYAGDASTSAATSGNSLIQAIVSVTVTGLNQTYDGTAKPVTVTLSTGVNGNWVTYGTPASNPRNNPPTSPGSYPISVNIVSGVGTCATCAPAFFTYNKTFTETIAGLPVQIVFGQMTYTYTGAPVRPPVTTNPAGYEAYVQFTFNGQTPLAVGYPYKIGTYAVVASFPSDFPFAGTASGTLTIQNTPLASVSLTGGVQGGAPSPSPQVNVGSRLALSSLVTGNATPNDATGTLTFNVDGLGVATVTANPAAASTLVLSTIHEAGYPYLAPGNHIISVSYSGDTKYTAASSGAMTVVVSNPSATITPGNLSQTYDGAAKTPSATTSPAGLAVNYSFAGRTSPPVSVGSYPFTATISDPIYSGSASGTLVINPLTVAVSLNGLSQTYDGTQRIVTAAGSPVNVPMTIGYSPAGAATFGPTPPIDAGSWDVSATSTDPNYIIQAASGSFLNSNGVGTLYGRLLVNGISGSFAVSGLVAYVDGTPKPVLVRATPAACAYTVSYINPLTSTTSTAAPSAAGTYLVNVSATNPTDCNAAGAGGTYFLLNSAHTTLQVTSGGQAIGTSQTTTYQSGYAFGLTITGDSPQAAGNVPSGTVTITDTLTTGGVTTTNTFDAKPINPSTGNSAAATTGSYPLAVGTHTMTATYPGDVHNLASSKTWTMVVNPTPVTVTMTNLTQTYSGSPLSPTVTLSAQYPYTVTYTGTGSTVYPQSSTAPTAAGTYTATATINSATASGSASYTFTITPLAVAITFGNLKVFYTGQQQAPTYTTVPAGVSVSLAYSPVQAGGQPPSGSGSYTVTASNPNVTFTTPVTATFVISPVMISDTVLTYTGLVQSVPYTSGTSPAPSSVQEFYTPVDSQGGILGAPVSPVNAGYYRVDIVACYTGLPCQGATARLQIQPLSHVGILFTSLSANADAARDPRPIGCQTTVDTAAYRVPCQVTYNGSTTAPGLPGTYAVVGTITDPNYSGTPAQGTYTIAETTNYAISVPNLTVNWDGQPHAVTGISMVPATVPVTYTYISSTGVSSTTPPTAADTYTVRVTANAPNTGTGQGFLTILAKVTFNSRTSDGSPAPALTLSGTPAVSGNVYYLTPGSYSLSVSTTPANPANTRVLFDGWSDGGAATHTITLGGAAQTFTATTHQQVVISVNQSAGGSAGFSAFPSVTTSTSQWVNFGSTYTVNAVSQSSAYVVSSVSGPSGSCTANPVTLRQFSCNLTANGPGAVSAAFAAAFQLNVQASAGGRASYYDGTTSQSVPLNNSIGIAANANPGYSFTGWTFNDGFGAPGYSSLTFSVSKPTGLSQFAPFGPAIIGVASNAQTVVTATANFAKTAPQIAITAGSHDRFSSAPSDIERMNWVVTNSGTEPVTQFHLTKVTGSTGWSDPNPLSLSVIYPSLATSPVTGGAVPAGQSVTIEGDVNWDSGVNRETLTVTYDYTYCQSYSGSSCSSYLTVTGNKATVTIGQ